MQWVKRLVIACVVLLLGIGLALAGLIFFGAVPAPPPMESIDAPFRDVDYRDLPGEQRFRAHADYLGDFARNRRPMALLVGGDDELFDAQKFAPLLQPVVPSVHAQIVPGVTHTGMVVRPAALEAIGAAVAALP
jgi:hypothetical protein